MLWVKIAVPAGVVIAAAVGFVPRLAAQGSLDQWAVNAATTAIRSHGNAEQAARASAMAHPGVTMTLFKTGAESSSGVPFATVSLEETVHTYISTLPGIKGWFQITTSQTVIGP